MEEIAAGLPMTYEDRPRWDGDFWARQGYACSIYENLNEAVYNQEEQIRYQAHPMFLVEVRGKMHRTRTLLIKIVMQAVHFIIVLLGISFLTFSIMHLSPRNPAELWLVGADGSAGMVSEEAVAEQERIMGLDRPFLVQYGTWLGNAVRGDLGRPLPTARR